MKTMSKQKLPTVEYLTTLVRVNIEIELKKQQAEMILNAKFDEETYQKFIVHIRGLICQLPRIIVTGNIQEKKYQFTYNVQRLDEKCCMTAAAERETRFEDRFNKERPFPGFILMFSDEHARGSGKWVLEW